MKKLNFYIVKDEYIEYLSNFDEHVSHNKNQKRPYIGIVLEVEGHLYFAPMYSPKPQHEKYKNNPTFFKLRDKNNNSLGLIRFAEMIPVPSDSIYKLDVTSRGISYNQLLNDQYEFINDNREIVHGKAEKMYELVTVKKQDFYISLSCDYKLLEEKCKEYMKDSSKNIY